MSEAAQQTLLLQLEGTDPSTPLYLCSDVGKPHCRDYPETLAFYESLIRKFPHACDSRRFYQNPENERLANGKDAHAILDYLLAMQADMFYGAQHSTFSAMIHRQRKHQGKPSVIV